MTFEEWQSAQNTTAHQSGAAIVRQGQDGNSGEVWRLWPMDKPKPEQDILTWDEVKGFELGYNDYGLLKTHNETYASEVIWWIDCIPEPPDA